MNVLDRLLNRREMLQSAGAGFGMLGLAGAINAARRPGAFANRREQPNLPADQTGRGGRDDLRRRLMQFGLDLQRQSVIGSSPVLSSRE